MNSSPENIGNNDSSHWHDVSLRACENPLAQQDCPKCENSGSLGASWYLKSIETREAQMTLKCSQCGFAAEFTLELPSGVMPCWPFDQFSLVTTEVEQEANVLKAKVQQHIQAMPAAQFATNPLWAEANWSATTYQWHPTSEAPPIMGLIFDNVDAGLQIFRDAEKEINHEDRFEEIRIAIIEDDLAEQGKPSGYSVHICADPEALCGHATMAEFVVDPQVIPFLGQWNRHYPIVRTLCCFASYLKSPRLTMPTWEPT
ncbi:MAG: hypothetical protein MI861_14940 [Pirellulales bacterium]|nr:hypothetical protein [Pirellulales bacterium]